MSSMGVATPATTIKTFNDLERYKYVHPKKDIKDIVTYNIILSIQGGIFENGTFPKFTRLSDLSEFKKYMGVIITSTNLEKLNNFPFSHFNPDATLTLFNNKKLMIYEATLPILVWKNNLDSLSLVDIILNNPRLEKFYIKNNLWKGVEWLDILSYFPQALNLWKKYGDPDLLTLDEILNFYPDTKLYL